MCSAAICSAIMIMPLASLSKTGYIDRYNNTKEQIDVLNKAMDSIPKDASVGASTFFVAHLADREELYEYPYKFGAELLPEYLVIDLRYNKISESDEKYFENNGYEEVEKVSGLYTILKR